MHSTSVHPSTLRLRLAGAILALLASVALGAPVHAATAPAKPKAAAEQGSITLNLKDADIREVAATVGEITGKNFIVDPQVQGKVTVISAKPITPDAVYEAFLSVLQVHGLAAVPAGEMTKIVPALEARQLAGIGPGPFSNAPGDAVVTEVIQINNVPATQLVPVLRPLMSTEAHLAAYAPSNMIIISARAANVERLLKIIKRIDQTTDNQVEIIPLEHASATEIVQVLSALSQGEPKGDTANPLRLAADERSNSILISGDRSERLRIRALISHLDTPLHTGGNTQVIYLRYAKAKDLAEILQGYIQKSASPDAKGKAAQPGGQNNDVSVLADEGTNALVVTAPPKTMQNIHMIVDKLDIRRAQVLVQGIIAELTSDRSAELGITWAADATAQSGTAGLTNFAGSGTGIAQVAAAGSAGTSGAASAAAGIPDGLTLGIGKIVSGHFSFAALLRALAGDSTTNIVSTPSILTLDNEEADIKVGQQVPFVTGQFTNTGAGSVNNGVVNPFQTIQRQQVGVELKITPRINEGNAVMLKIDQEVSSLSGGAQGAVDLITNNRSITTNVIAENGEIVVLGGLIDNHLVESNQQVPVLGSIPVLGNLFKYRKTTKTKRNLMVFLQPRILRSSKSTSFYTNDKYNDMRDMQLDNDRSIQLMPGQKRPLLPSYDELTKPGPGDQRTDAGHKPAANDKPAQPAASGATPASSGDGKDGGSGR